MITVEVDKKTLAAFERSIKLITHQTGKSMNETLKQQGKLFALDAAKYTSRFGNKASIGKKHKEDIEKTIRRVYSPLGGNKNLSGWIKQNLNPGASKLWNKTVRKRDAAGLKRLAVMFNIMSASRAKSVEFIEWDKGAAHTRRLKGKGKGKKYYVFGPAKNINAYIKKKKAQVGEAKSGWVKAARMLGHTSNRKSPQWMHKGHKTRGHGEVRGRGLKAVAKVAHYGKYAFSKTSLNGVYKFRSKMIIKQMTKAIRAEAKKQAAKV